MSCRTYIAKNLQYINKDQLQQKNNIFNTIGHSTLSLKLNEKKNFRSTILFLFGFFFRIAPFLRSIEKFLFLYLALGRRQHALRRSLQERNPLEPTAPVVPRGENEATWYKLNYNGRYIMAENSHHRWPEVWWRVAKRQVREGTADAIYQRFLRGTVNSQQLHRVPTLHET